MGRRFAFTLLAALALAGVALALPQRNEPNAEAAALRGLSEAKQTVRFDTSGLNADVRAAAESARAVQRRTEVAARQARDAATRAVEAAARARRGAAGHSAHATDSGARYEGEFSSQANGYGIFTSSPSSDYAGDRYEGMWTNNDRSGVGVYHFARNAANTVGSLRYEGEWARHDRNGVGVYYWNDGIRYVGEMVDNDKQGYGVMYFADGARYEGQWDNDDRNGYGVEWDAAGLEATQGVWRDDVLVTPLNANSRSTGTQAQSNATTLANTTWNGTYRYDTMPSSERITIEFRSGGRAQATHIGQTQDWTYQVSGTRVTLEASSGSTWTATLRDGTMTGTMLYPGHGGGVFTMAQY